MYGDLIDGCFEFLRLVTLNSLGLIPQLERRERSFLITLKWSFYSMNQTKFHNQYARIPKYMNRGYPSVHTNLKSKRFLEKYDLSHKMRGMRVP